MEKIPGEKEWGSSNDLDEKHAKSRFFGLSKIEAADIFVKYTCSASEDLTNMPTAVMEFYLESLYIALAKSSFDSVGKLGVYAVIQYVVEQLSGKSQICSEMLKRVLERFLVRKKYFKIDASTESVLLSKLDELCK